MLELANQSSWQAGLFPGWGPDRAMQQTLVVKLAWRFALDGRLEPLLPAPPLELADRHHGDPLTSSLAAACEIVPFKHGAEVLLSGTAYPPRPGVRVMTTELGLDFADGRQWRKTLRICGPRIWRKGIFGALPGAPAPLEPLPLRYEYAFGGVDTRRRSLFTDNPVGRGFAKRGKVQRGQPLPQIELEAATVRRASDQVRPGGYGPIPAGWTPRYDASADHAAGDACGYPQPVPPALFNCAPLDQRYEVPFRGGERVILRGFFPELSARDNVDIALPRVTPQAYLLRGERSVRLRLACDTLSIDCDHRQLSLLFRVGITHDWLGDSGGWVVLREAEAEAAA